jgi:hypothetical protein
MQSENICLSCASLGLSVSPNSTSHFLDPNHQHHQQRHQSQRPLANLCGTKPFKQSHSMYNFDAASFPEFSYIKNHMLQNDVSILATESSSSLVESFLKNFEKGLLNLNESIEKSKSMTQFDSFTITGAIDSTKEHVGHLSGKEDATTADKDR